MVGRNISKRVALYGVMAALTVALSMLEGIFDIPIAVPGAKVGLSNVVVVAAATVSGFGGAIYITAIKSLFVLVTRGATAFILSLSGGLLSSLATVLILKYLKRYFSLIGISIVGAFMHNLGQLIAATVIIKTRALIWYLPVLSLLALFFGTVVGIILKGTEPYIKKLSSERKVDKT